MGLRACERCGHQLSADANFCRTCRAPVSAPAAAPERKQAAGGRSWGVILVGAAIVIASAAIALAILLSRSGHSPAADASSQAARPGNAAEAPSLEEGGGEDTIPAAATARSIEPGRYVQAGSFKVAADAETEQRRLAGLGIETNLLRSEMAQELYPGFQVLVVGPIRGRNEELSTIGKLRHGGVPTAFARELTPAASSVRYADVAGNWRGTLEEISSSHPRLDRKLTVSASFVRSGREGQLDVPSLHCRPSLSAVGSSETTVSFDQYSTCLASGSWIVRPSGGSLMMTLLPSGSDLIFLGTLSAA